MHFEINGRCVPNGQGSFDLVADVNDKQSVWGGQGATASPHRAVWKAVHRVIADARTLGLTRITISTRNAVVRDAAVGAVMPRKRKLDAHLRKYLDLKGDMDVVWI